MVNLETARNLCLSLPETSEYDHFGRPAYRVKKKIFATLWLDEKRVVLKFSAAEQNQFCERFPSAIYPVKGAWGKYGWTNVDLNKIRETVFKKALTLAWMSVAPKSLSKKINS